MQLKLKIIQKLMDNSKFNGECIEWTGFKAHGYGRFVLYKKPYRAHRAAAFALGVLKDIDSELFVCHKCDNKSCFNPTHLFVGTAKDNAIDLKNKGLTIRGEENNKSKLTVKQVKEIFKMYDQNIEQPTIAKKYGLTRSGVRRILIGKSWGHLNLKLSFGYRSTSYPILCNNGKKYKSTTECAKKLNLDGSSIYRVVVGKRSHTKGYIFTYASSK